MTSSWETAPAVVTKPVYWRSLTPLATKPLVPKLQLLFAISARKPLSTLTAWSVKIYNKETN